MRLDSVRGLVTVKGSKIDFITKACVLLRTPNHESRGLISRTQRLQTTNPGALVSRTGGRLGTSNHEWRNPKLSGARLRTSKHEPRSSAPAGTLRTALGRVHGGPVDAIRAAKDLKSRIGTLFVPRRVRCHGCPKGDATANKDLKSRGFGPTGTSNHES